MIKRYKQYLHKRVFWIALGIQGLLIGLFYLVFYLNNTQLAANRAIDPLRSQITALGFSVDALKRKGECDFPSKGRNLNLNVLCRSDDIESMIRFDDSLKRTWSDKAADLVQAFEANGWEEQRNPHVELVDLKNFVGPGKTTGIEFRKRVGRSHCTIMFLTDDRFPTVSMLSACLQKRTFLIF